MNRDFTIVFAKLSERESCSFPDQPGGAESVSFRISESDAAEMRELDELRRIANAIAEPEPSYFTLT